MRQALGTLALTLLLAACASGPKFNTVENRLSALAPGKARVFFYRSTALGGAIQPEVKLNGAVIGKAEPHGVFYVDADPGNLEVITGSEVDRKLTFTAAAGETRYVRLAVGLGVLVYRIYPELVDASEARKDIAELSFTGALRK